MQSLFDLSTRPVRERVRVSSTEGELAPGVYYGAVRGFKDVLVLVTPLYFVWLNKPSLTPNLVTKRVAESKERVEVCTVKLEMIIEERDGETFSLV